MNPPILQLALREWRTHMALPARIAGLLGAAVILTLIAPFDTDTIERVAPRFAYWLTLVVMTYSAGFFANMLVGLTPALSDALWKRIIAACVLTSVGVFAVIYLLNGLALDFWPRGRILAEAIFNVTLIATIITVVFNLIQEPQDRAAATALHTAPAPPTILDRLPFDKRASLVSLSVEDHYVRVRTTKGEEMVLMRLTDAIREVGDTPGLHVHRSHWAALGEVASVTRKGDGAQLTTRHGPDIPVSRANLAKIREAGLLPRS